MQKKAIRIIAGVSKLEHCKNIFIDLKILSLYSLYTMQCLMFLRANFQKVHCRNVIHSHETRFSHNLNLPQVRLVKSDNSPLIMASRMYNQIPIAIRDLKDKDFKAKMEMFLLRKAFYSLEEFFAGKWTLKDFE